MGATTMANMGAFLYPSQSHNQHHHMFNSAAAAAAMAAVGQNQHAGPNSLFKPPITLIGTNPSNTNSSQYLHHKSLLSLCTTMNSLKHGNLLKEDQEVTSSEEATTKTTANESSSDVKTAHSMSDTEKKPLLLDLYQNRIDLPIVPDQNARRNLEASCMTLFPAESIYETAAKLLFLSIKWARTIPSFLQLSYRDQSILLEESWNELFILTAAQWSLQIDEVILLTNTSATNQPRLEEDARRLRDVINRLTLLRVDHTEHACLKALVLFKAECRGLCEAAHVELLQDQTHVMLHEYCAQRSHIGTTSPRGRFGKLLLALPAVQAVSRTGLEELLFRQTVGDVTIDRLLQDLATATNS